MISSLLDGSPATMRKVHGFQMLFWLAMSAAAELTGLVDSARYISRLSEVALFLTAWSSYQAARAGGDVVDAMVDDPRIPTEGAT